MKLRIFLIFFIFHIGILQLLAQNNEILIGSFPFTNYGVKDGLPQEDIIAIFQDKKGFIWVGTYYGAARYDGREMKQFNTLNGLINNSINDIKEDKNENIYFATLRGISVLNQKTNVIDTIFKDIPFKKILIDNENNKFFYGDTGIFLQTSKKELRNLNKEIPNLPLKINEIDQPKGLATFIIASDSGLFCLKDKRLEKIWDKPCFSIFTDKEKTLWLASEEGIFFSDFFRTCLNDEFVFRRISKFAESLISYKMPKCEVRQFSQSQDGSIWVTSTYQVFQILSRGQEPIVFDNTTGLNNQAIYKVFFDNENNIWFGAAGGMQKLSNKSIRIIYPDGYVNKIFEDKKNRLWFIANNSVFFLKDNVVVPFSDKISIDNKTFGIELLKSGNILIINGEGSYEVNVNSLNIETKIKFSTPITYIEAIFVNSKSNIFIMSGDKGEIYFMKNISSNYITLQNKYTTGIYQLIEFQGDVIGANSSGLTLFRDGNFVSLCDLNVSAWGLLVEDGKLWCSTEKGVGVYNGKNIEYLSPSLIANDVNALISAVDSNYFWLGKNDGLYYIEKKNPQKYQFFINSKDGMPGNEVAISGFFIDSEKRLWVGTYHGIFTFTPQQRNTAKHPPLVHLSIRLNREKVENLKSQLNHFENNLYFEITAVSFKDEKAIEYEFHLEGLETDYLASKGKEFKANYQNLKTGKYSFKYRAKGKDNIWSEFYSVNFEILKPFWQETWFYLILGILFLGLIFVFVRIRLKVLQKKNEFLEKTVKERTSEIELQKGEIMERNEELLQQKEELVAQSELLHDINDALEQKNVEVEQMVEQLESMYTELNEKSKILEKLSIVASKTDNSVIIFDSQGDMEWVNEGFGRLLGVTMEDFRERFGGNIYKNSLNPNIKEIIDEAISEKKSVNYVCKTFTAEGKEMWFQTTLTPIFNEKSELHKLIAIDTDISKVKLAEKEITNQKKKITDSIQYASRIQNAILTPQEVINQYFSEYFLLYLPKDIVSGDFYWFQKKNEKLIISLADCTGHGVSGAFMSILGISFLNEIVSKMGDLQSNEILNQLREAIISALHQHSTEKETRDGLDISLCIIDKNEKTLEYSGANNSAYIIRKNIENQEIIELKPDKMPIGLYTQKGDKPFSSQKISLEENDILYLFSDGFIDLFGGEGNRRFSVKQFKEVILKIQKFSLFEQKLELATILEEWRHFNGKMYEQLDDISVLGVKIF